MTNWWNMDAGRSDAHHPNAVDSPAPEADAPRWLWLARSNAFYHGLPAAERRFCNPLHLPAEDPNVVVG